MNAVFRPVGPEEPQVYWKRRALAAGIVLVLLLALLVGFRSVLSSGDDPQTSQTSAQADAASPDTEPGPTADTDAVAKSPSPTPETPSPTPGGPCKDSDIQVALTTDAATYSGIKRPSLTMTITNVGEVSCKRQAGSDQNEILITSGGVRVFSSDDCSADSPSEEFLLESGAAAVVEIKWNRKITSPGCGDPTPAAPGVYQAVGTNGDVSSGAATFTLG